jgi:hypothetical protein
MRAYIVLTEGSVSKLGFGDVNLEVNMRLETLSNHVKA